MLDASPANICCHDSVSQCIIIVITFWSFDNSVQIDREELVAFLVEKSQKLSVDKDFVLAMDRLIQFALHMRQRERMAQVNTGSGRCLAVYVSPHN